MSNLLERAIIDAKALKEAALKNAEQLVIEKYSEEVRTAMDSLLSEAPGDAGMPNPGFDAGGDLGAGDNEMLGLGDDPGFDQAMASADPLSDPTDTAPDNEEGGEEGDRLDPDSLLGTIPDAFSSDDDEIISIKLDSLEAEYEDEEDDGRFGGEDEFQDGQIGIDITDDEELEFDDDFEQEFSDAGDEDVGIDITQDVVQEVLGELGISEEEIDLEELMEKVTVDFEPQKSGWAGTPEPQMREYESMLLAREQDTEVKEENEELRKNVAALKQENKTISSAAVKLQEKNKEYETAFLTLQEKLETMNVSNAKLLYINQALENASLNERQKRKIVEAISKADTVQEAKIVFDTMNDAVSTTLDAKRDSTLNEVVSRRSSLLVAARNEQPKKDANPLYNRMQKLAGIKTQKS